jgi:hypothetical protein
MFYVQCKQIHVEEDVIVIMNSSQDEDVILEENREITRVLKNKACQISMLGFLCTCGRQICMDTGSDLRMYSHALQRQKPCMYKCKVHVNPNVVSRPVF